MREHGIDGVFLQRFANELKDVVAHRNRDSVLGHVRQGAKQTGRTYAVMYDLSGLPAGGVKTVRDDWKQLRSELRLTEDESYQHHQGKPVVAVWGVGFGGKNKAREYSLAECRELIEHLKEDRCCVMLGVPTGWRNLERDALADPQLHEFSNLRTLSALGPWGGTAHKQMSRTTPANIGELIRDGASSVVWIICLSSSPDLVGTT